jgi:uncharacterized protein with HEPN domain
MPKKRNIIDFVNDILEGIFKAEEFIKDMSFEDFEKDDKTVFATIRAMEIIGEASTHIPGELREEYSEIPWKRMIGMRNILIHQYFGFSKPIIWSTIKKRFPGLKEHLKKMLNDEMNKSIESSGDGILLPGREVP